MDILDNNKQEFAIKIPVYVSESISKENGLLNYTYEEMVNDTKIKIDHFNEQSKNIIAKKRNAPREKEISSMSYY